MGVMDAVFSMVGCIRVYLRWGGFLVGVIIWVLIAGVSFLVFFQVFCIYTTSFVCTSPISVRLV